MLMKRVKSMDIRFQSSLCGREGQVEFAGGPFAWVTRTFQASAGNCHQSALLLCLLLLLNNFVVFVQDECPYVCRLCIIDLLIFHEQVVVMQLHATCYFLHIGKLLSNQVIVGNGRSRSIL